eukprot:4333716-Alexandrium_andersonii.AAC.1
MHFDEFWLPQALDRPILRHCSCRFRIRRRNRASSHPIPGKCTIDSFLRRGARKFLGAPPERAARQ